MFARAVGGGKRSGVDLVFALLERILDPLYPDLVVLGAEFYLRTR
jgi:hypothetical protein